MKKLLVSYKGLKRVFYILCVITIVLFLVNYPKNNIQLLNYYHTNYIQNNYDIETIDNNFTIDTEGCRIPSLNPFDDEIMKYVEYPNHLPRCLNTSSLILEHNKTHIWIRQELLDIKEVAEVISCCYRAFYRPASIDDINESVDNRVQYDKCINFSKIIEAKHEFVKVNCSIGIIKVEEYFLFAIKKEFKSRDDFDQDGKYKAAYNILMLGIDSVSRLNFLRTMPLTVRYLQERGALDFAGYNKVGDNTFPNLVPMLLGISDEEIKRTCLPYKSAKFDNCPFIWEWFKQSGFYTALAEDSAWLGTFNYLRAGFSITPTDYYTHTFINEAEKYASKPNGFNTSQLCLNSKYFYQVLLDYMEDLVFKLKGDKFFGLFWEITMSHDDLNYPMVMDKDYVGFLKRLEVAGFLQNSIIFLTSDHGIRWGDIRYTKQGRLEERLPFVFLLLPPCFREKYSVAYYNLKLNTKRLTTPYDVHSTLDDLTNLDNINDEIILSRSKQNYYKSRGISLFLPVPSNRTCRMAGISNHWCTCHKSVEMSQRDENVVSAATHLVKYINKLIRHYRNCAKLVLVEVIEATEMLTGRAESKEIDSWREFMIVINTMPGRGMFEATVRGTGQRWAVAGTVGRLNLYGNQSYCINDNLLKLYCYCK